MLTGHDTLAHLSTKLKHARRELERLEQALQATSQAVTENRRLQADALRRLAALRLGAIQQGEVVRLLDAADARVGGILERRESAMSEVNRRVAEAMEVLDALEDRREALHADVEAAARVVAEREAAVQSGLESDEGFRAQLQRTREADAVALSAAEKAELAAADRREKGRPFERDELFMYLWKRGYGTSAYRAHPLARLLDAWVARRCRFGAARPNYSMLLEIPKRLRQHAENARAEAERELDELQAIEERAARDGGVRDAQAALAEAEQRQDESDADIARSEVQLRELRAEQSRYASGDDSYVAECLAVFSKAMGRQDIRDLTHLARATLSVEDDAIVDELRRLRREDAGLQAELERNRKLQGEHVRRVEELEEVRHRFKSHRYDDLRSGFDNGDLILRMIGEVVAGALRGGDLWDVLRRYQRYTETGGAWPDFGSGGIVRGGRRRGSKRRPTWHWPGAKGPDRGDGFTLPRLPGKGSRGRGGFRTGGGV